MAGSLFAINIVGYYNVTPSQRLVCVTHNVMLLFPICSFAAASLEEKVRSKP